MIIGGLFMVKHRVVAMADWPGKIATGLFAVGVMLSLLSFLSLNVEPYNLYILGLATAMSYFALVFYAATQLPRAFGKESKDATKADENGHRAE